MPISGVFDVPAPQPPRADLRRGRQPEGRLADDAHRRQDAALPRPLRRQGTRALGKQAAAFAKAVKEKNGKVEVKMIENRDHGSIMRNIAKPDDEATRAIFAFIRGK